MEFGNLTRLQPALAAIFGGVLLAACSSNSSNQPDDAAALNQLRTENQAVVQLRRDNQDLARLRQDNAEILKLRPFSSELARLRAENQELRTQAGLKPEDRLADADASGSASGKPGARGTGAPGDPATTDAEAEVDPADLPQEGDDILVEPKYLAALLPGFDWEKIERKEPISIKSILEQKGIVLSNYKQLVDLGLTNYVIRRNPPPAPAEP